MIVHHHDASTTLGGVAVGACALAGGRRHERDLDSGQRPTMDIQLLSFNDFHGNLEPPTGSSGRLVTGHTLTDRRAGDGHRRPSTAGRRRRRVPRDPPQGGAEGPPEHR